ncbi:UNVERIFIED_CONTAM: hypothetical protein Sradi_3047900 [Sesamum radiatum]|uniref:Uncharacterized protein n=1 Tax=Sesamum radiatum TaxID=300843 RepID=A0AAW2RBI8_SESRA
MENSQEEVYMCPSFSSYSSDRLAEIAVKVAAENSSDNGDEDFEFALVRQEREVLAEEFFYDGQIGPVFPLFIEDREDHEPDNPSSCSSSEADEMENIPAGTYCVWRPKAAEQPSPSRCNKSKSTGSGSKRWKIRDLLRRSNSDGKDSFVFLTPKNREENPQPKLLKKPRERV